MAVLLTDDDVSLGRLVWTKLEDIYKVFFLGQSKKHFLLVIKDNQSMIVFNHQKLFVCGNLKFLNFSGFLQIQVFFTDFSKLFGKFAQSIIVSQNHQIIIKGLNLLDFMLHSYFFCLIRIQIQKMSLLILQDQQAFVSNDFLINYVRLEFNLMLLYLLVAHNRQGFSIMIDQLSI